MGGESRLRLGRVRYFYLKFSEEYQIDFIGFIGLRQRATGMFRVLIEMPTKGAIVRTVWCYGVVLVFSIMFCSSGIAGDQEDPWMEDLLALPIEELMDVIVDTGSTDGFIATLEPGRTPRGHQRLTWGISNYWKTAITWPSERSSRRTAT